MDIRGFQVSFGARADTRAAARGARGTVGPERGRGIEGSDRAWCGRGPALSALRERRGGFARYGAGSAALPEGLRQDLQRAERYAAVGPAPQGTLAVVRGVAGEGGDGEGLGGALRRGGEHGIPRHRFLAAARSDSEVLKGIVEADETYVLESRKGARGLGRKARRRGGKAKKRGLSREQVPVLMAADRSGTTVSAVLPRVDAAALTAALDPVVAKDALLVSDGGASYPPCAAALGVSHETLNRSMGERVRGDLHVQTVNSRHSRLKDFLRPRRGIATRYLDNYLSWFHLVGLAPGANDRACLAAAVTVTHTIH